MRKFKIILILYVTLISFTLTAQNFNIDPLKYSNKPRYQPYLGQSTNNLHYFGSIFDFEADRVADDFGPRRYTDKYGVVHYYDWHSGVDYNVQSQHGNPANNNGEGAMIKSISSGQIIDYDQILSPGFKSIGVKNKYCKDANYTASNNPNCTDTGFRYFYYEHIFERSSNSSVPRDFQGCSLMWIDGSLPKDKKWTVVFKNNGSYSAIGPHAGTVTFNDENGSSQTVTVKNMIDIDEPLAPLGGSVGYTPHAHIQTMTEAVQNPGGDDVRSKNVIEFVPHEDPNYSIKIRDELTTNPIALLYPGNKTTLIRVMPTMPSAVQGNSKRYPTLYNVDRVKINIKKDFQAVSEYKNLIGKTTLADFCLGARYATNLTNMGRKPTDLGSSTKIGMRSNCYSDNNPEKYDEFFFYDFMSAIHKNADYLAKKSWVADNPENALYTDGKYHVSAEVQKVNNNIQYSNPEDLYLDNYFPYISSAIIQFSKKTYSQKYLGDYAVFWKPFENKGTVYGDGYVSYAATNKCKPKEDLEESVLGDIVIFATTQEPLIDLKLKVNGIGANLISRDYLNNFNAANNTFETKFRIKGYGSSLKTIGKIALEFTGEDVYKNPLLDVAKYHKNYSFMVPKRKDYGYTVVDKCEDKCWTPKPIFGKDDFHIFDLGACKPVAIVNDCIENSQIESKITRSISSGGSISLTVGGVNPNTLGLGLKIAWKKGDEDLPLFNNLFTITGLSEGFYCYQITCECCTFGDCIEVPSCPSLLKDFTTTLASCPGGGNASITITATNGTAPCTYKWSNGKTTASINNLEKGTYTVTITDAEGCKSEHPFIIAEPVEIKATVTNICSATELGSIVLDVKDNRPPSPSPFFSAIEFSWTKFNGGTWEPFSTEQNLVDLKDGGKFKLYYDDGSCFELIGEYEVKKSNFQVSYTISPVNGASGECTFTVDSGTAPFQYEFTGGVLQSGTVDKIGVPTNIGKLEAETYDLKVTDANGCVKEFKIKIYDCKDPDLDDPTVDITNISTKGAADGIIRLTTLDQDDPNVFFEWKGPNSFTANTRSIKNLSEPGEYCVHIVNKSCGKERDFCWKLEFGCLVVINSVIKNSCGDSGGSIEIFSTSGQAPFTYTWNDGNTDQNRKGLAIGKYKVTVTDALKCSTIETFTVNTGNLKIVQPECLVEGLTNNVQVNASYNGNPTCSDCTYLWSDGNTSKSRQFLGKTGTFTVKVKNPQGCEDNATYNIMLAAIFPDCSIPPAPQGNGVIQLVMPDNYEVKWEKPIGVNKYYGSLFKGSYKAQISSTDGKCVVNKVFTVSQVSSSNITTVSTPCKNKEIQILSYGFSTIYPIYAYIDDVYAGKASAYTDILTIQAKNVTSKITIKDSRGCILEKIVPTPDLTLKLKLDPFRNCSDKVNVSAELIDGNGAKGSPYTFVWSDGFTEKTFDSYSRHEIDHEKAYSVTVTNAVGCKESISGVTPKAPTNVRDDTNINVLNACNGLSNGQILISDYPFYDEYVLDNGNKLSYDYKEGNFYLKDLKPGAYNVTRKSLLTGCGKTFKLYVSDFSTSPISVTTVKVCDKCIEVDPSCVPDGSAHINVGKEFFHYDFGNYMNTYIKISFPTAPVQTFNSNAPYYWNHQYDILNVKNLPKGEFDFIVTDLKRPECSGSGTIKIEQADQKPEFREGCMYWICDNGFSITNLGAVKESKPKIEILDMDCKDGDGFTLTLNSDEEYKYSFDFKEIESGTLKKGFNTLNISTKIPYGGKIITLTVKGTNCPFTYTFFVGGSADCCENFDKKKFRFLVQPGKNGTGGSINILNGTQNSSIVNILNHVGNGLIYKWTQTAPTNKILSQTGPFVYNLASGSDVEYQVEIEGECKKAFIYKFKVPDEDDCTTPTPIIVESCVKDGEFYFSSDDDINLATSYFYNNSSEGSHGGNNTYSWFIQKNKILPWKVDPIGGFGLETGTYTVVVYKNNGCKSTQTVTIPNSKDQKIEWDDNSPDCRYRIVCGDNQSSWKYGNRVSIEYPTDCSFKVVCDAPENHTITKSLNTIYTLKDASTCEAYYRCGESTGLIQGTITEGEVKSDLCVKKITCTFPKETGLAQIEGYEPLSSNVKLCSIKQSFDFLDINGLWQCTDLVKNCKGKLSTPLDEQYPTPGVISSVLLVCKYPSCNGLFVGEPNSYKTSALTNNDTKLEADLSIESINVYPNPFSDFVNVTIEMKFKDKVTVRLYDILGRVVAEKSDFFEAGDSSFLLEVAQNSNVNNYILEVKDSKGNRTFEKLIRIRN